MSWNRREVLGVLGGASASALAWAFTGCRSSPTVRAPVVPIAEGSDEVRAWLHDAVASLRGAGFARAHALAVRRTRATAAVDVLGSSVARARADGVVLVVETERGVRERASSELTRGGVAAAVRALAPKATAPATIEFGPAPPAIASHGELDSIGDRELIDRVASIEHRELPGRVVYAAGVIDIDDATVWSVEEHRDLVQRRVRVRRAMTRVAWDRERPSAIEVSRAWSGGIDDQTFDDEQIAYARDTALEVMTPTAFSDGIHPIVLAPSVAAAVIDAAVGALLTSRAQMRPEVVARLTADKATASPALTLVDDPAAPGTYGGFDFDDEGAPAQALTLVDRGVTIAALADRAGVAAKRAQIAGRGRRPGHTGPVEPMPSHLRLAPGAGDIALADGFQLDSGRVASVDPASGRAVIEIARARELAAGRPTGRVYSDLELVGDLATLLGNIAEASKQTRTFGIRDERDGLPTWRSIEAPYLRGSGMIRARRGELA
ncbi:MAG TPA: metallopeptidase TldD-related protein [Kofleriaceae bacterium]|nr:metallopeptidase TldD-related protein [Kofleriaceae bacterium]